MAELQCALREAGQTSAELYTRTQRPTSMWIALATLGLAPSSMVFVGNSHTHVNNVPDMVRELLHSDGTGRRATVQTHVVGFLEDYQRNPAIDESLRRHPDFLILQGAKISSSHRYTYSQAEAVRLARNGVAAGSKVLIVAEWSRKGWAETDYILGVVNPIAKQSGGTVIPICQAFDRAIQDDARWSLWSSDGNHASLEGSYLAATSIYRACFGREGAPTWFPTGLSKDRAARLRAFALTPERV